MGRVAADHISGGQIIFFISGKYDDIVEIDDGSSNLLDYETSAKLDHELLWYRQQIDASLLCLEYLAKRKEMVVDETGLLV